MGNKTSRGDNPSVGDGDGKVPVKKAIASKGDGKGDEDAEIERQKLLARIESFINSPLYLVTVPPGSGLLSPLPCHPFICPFLLDVSCTDHRPI